MNEQTVTKIISTLEQSGSETVALYAERTVTYGISFVLLGALLTAISVGIYCFMLWFHRQEIDPDDKVIFHITIAALGVLVAGCALIAFFAGTIRLLHPEAIAIEQLITQIRGD